MKNKISKLYMENYLNSNFWCYLDASKRHGIGVYALRDIPMGTNILVNFPYEYEEYFKINELNLDKSIIEWFNSITYSEEDHVWIILNSCTNHYFKNYINDSGPDDPTSVHHEDQNGEYIFSTFRDIKKGEELAYDYDSWDEHGNRKKALP